MGWFDFVLDPIGSTIADAAGMNSPADYAFSLPTDYPGMWKKDWSAIKHLLVPDMRRDREAMTNSALTNRRVVYGTCRVSGQLAYAESAGSKNEFLHLIVILASHPVTSIQEIYLDDRLASEYGTDVEYKLFNGTQTTACAEMIAASAGKWTAAHVLNGCAYIYLKLTYNETSFASGLPTVKVVLNGKPLFDPRTGLTTSISDPNVKVVVKPVDDQSGGYTGWNDNPALCVRDYMLTPEEQGGMGCTTDEIDDAYFIVAANICDQWVPKTTDDTQQEKRFTCSGTFEINSTPKKIVDALLQSMAGTPQFIQGKWQIFAGACGSITGLVTLDESWLNGGISFKLGASKSEKINTIKGTFVDPDDHWASKGFPPVTSATYISEDGNEELSEDITLNFTISPSMAQRLGKIIMEQSRRSLQVEYPCNFKAFKLTPHQLVRVDNTLLGWSQKLMRVVDWEFAGAGGIKLTLIEEDPNIYNWLPGDVVEIPEVPLTILPDPWVVTPPSSLTLTPRIYDYNSGTATRVDLDVSWTAGGPGQLRYDLQYRIIGQTWSGIISVGYDTIYTLPTLTAGEYEVRLRGANSIGAVSDWISAIQAVPLPDTVVPDVTGLEIVGQGNNYQFVGRDIALGWNYVSPRADTDVSGPGRGSSWFRYYVIEVYTTGDVLRRTDYTTHERYTYTYEMNRQDGLGTAIRTVKFSVRIMSAWGALSDTPAAITCTNPPIAQLTGLTVVGGINSLFIGLPHVSEPDFEGYDVYASQTAAFTPGISNKINGGGPETVITLVDVNPGLWYVRAAGRDSFGTDGANFSDEYSTAVSSLLVTPEMLDGAARTDFFVRDTILYFDAAVLTWDAGFIDRGEHTYTLAAGALAAANASYIIATFNDTGYTATLSKTPVTSGLPTLTTAQAIIAVTSDNLTPQGNYYCYVRQANSVSIEGALIRAATVGFLQISDTIESSTYSYGVSGWKINKHGNCEFNNVEVMGTITGSMITGGTFRTAEAGERFQVDETTNRAHFYDADNYEVATIGPGSTTIESDDYDSYATFGNLTSTAGFRAGLNAWAYSGPAVLGWSMSGYGIHGNGATGVYGFGGVGVRGESHDIGVSGFAREDDIFGGAYGGVFEGKEYTYLGNSRVNFPLKIVPSGSSSAPTETATIGTLWVTSAGVLYIYTSTGWQKVGAQ